MLSELSAECRYAECCYAEYHYVVMLCADMLSVAFYYCA
jgi:hypothetical protein